DIDREDGEITGRAHTKEPFVRRDVPRCLRGIAEGYEVGAYIELSEDRRRQRKQIGESHNSCCFALFVDAADCHSASPPSRAAPLTFELSGEPAALHMVSPGIRPGEVRS